MTSRPHSIYIDDELWGFLVSHAAKRQQSVGKLVNEALTESLMFGRGSAKAQTQMDVPDASGPTHRKPATKLMHTGSSTTVSTSPTTSSTIRPGQYSADELKAIDAERLARMKPKGG